MRRGEIWTVVPREHPKPRPAVIMSVDAWNHHAQDVILVPLTTRPGPSRPPVRHTRLRQASFAKCGSMAALPKTRLKECLGQLDDATVAGIAAELRRLLGI